MFIDGRGIGSEAELEFDVVIVGAGMAGITLAERLRGAGKRICLIESGGFDLSRAQQRLNAGTNIGHRYFDLDRCRLRVFGGASVRWGGMCLPLAPHDFLAREWMPLSGWPLRHEDLVPYFDQAAEACELSMGSFAPAEWSERLSPAPLVGAPDLETVILQNPRGVDFGGRVRREYGAATDVTVLLHSTVTELRLGPGTDRVQRAEVGTLGGHRFSVRATTFVLAGGGVENPRILLASRRDRVGGLGNESDFVGRCFMEHVHASPGHIVPFPGADLSPFFAEHRFAARDIARRVLTPTADAVDRAALPTCFFTLGTLGEVSGPNFLVYLPRVSLAPLMAVRQAAGRVGDRSGRAGLARRVVPLGGKLWRLGRSAREVWRSDVRSLSDARTRVSVYARAEQTPNPSSRVTLDTARDALGVPRPRLDWRIADRDLDALDHWTDALDRSLRACGQGTLQRRAWREHVVGGPHHLGTTRMSRSPAEGVVDGDSRVHTVANLYVAGSSVFTTGGYANPSFTLLALTLRLADHLRSRI